MSNFLRALAERTVAPAREGKLQPRLASRFESGPLPATSAATRQVNGPTEADPSLPRPPSFGHDFRALPAESLSPALDSAAIGSRSHLHPVTTNSAAFAPTNPPPPFSLGSTNAFSAAEINASPNPSVLSSAEDRSASARFASTLLVEPTTARTPTAAPPSSVGAAAPPAPFERNAPTSLQPRSESVFAASVASGRDGAPPVPAASLLSSAPAIRVHIGRVDIRAIHLPPAPATPRPPAPERRPLLPLEDYLKRQDSR